MLKYKRYNVLLCIIPNEKIFLGGFCFIMKTKKFKLIALCGVLAMAFGAFGFTATNVSADSNVAYIDANANNQVDDGEGFATLQDAVNAAQAGDTIKLVSDIETTGTVKVVSGKEITLDLAGYTISATDTKASGNYDAIYNEGTLTIQDSVGGGAIEVIAENNRAWNNYSAVISNQWGVLTIDSGRLQHFGGTDMAYAIDNRTNTGAKATILVINGGEIISTYRAIRAFQNSSKAVCEVEVNGGMISGNVGIWMQQSGGSSLGALSIVGGTLDCYSNAVLVSISTANSDTSVEITGGEFKNENPNGNLIWIKGTAGTADMTITGGTFDCAGEGKLIGNESGEVLTLEISGGSFSDDSVVEYLTDDANVTIGRVDEEENEPEIEEDESIEDILMGKLPGILGGASGILGIIFGTQNTNGAMVDGGMSALTITLIVIATILAVACVAVGVLMFLDHKGLVDVKKLCIKVENCFKDLWDKIVKLFKK